jgi:asparagine synthase (glutamine-hydrolysing)
MCGIAGFLSTNKSTPLVRADMDKVLSKIAHRGPDGTGIWSTENGTVILGHKRLSIVDLNQNANQPMMSKGYGIVFNGEIYNHRILRQELEKEGVLFQTDHSDTEVLLNGYIHWGIERLLAKVNGMFAFAIYDETRKRVLLCRDRIGIKNLYFSKIDGQLVFCSEIKGILEAGMFRPELNKQHLNEYLLNRSLSAPNTLFRHVYKLKSASLLTVDLNTLEICETSYWCPLEKELDPKITSQAELEEELEMLFSSSIDFRLESDVPVGLFLSGGVDSNYILSIFSKKREGIKCFTASYPDENKYDEAFDARKMADKYRAEYIEVPVTSDKYLDTLEQVVYFQEEPISAPVCVPVYLLSAAASEHNVPVVLAGEGSDEIFIGYHNWLRFRQVQSAFNSIPFSRELSRFASFIISKRLNPLSPFLDVLERSSSGHPLFWGGAMDMNCQIRELLLRNGKTASELNLEIFEKNIRPNLERFNHKRPLGNISAWMSYMDLQHRLPELMLPRLDKMGMAHSIEGRVPYLDHRIVELVFSVPESVMQENRWTGKAALKSLAAAELGQEFVYRKKKGFQAPVAEWRQGSFGQLTELLEEFAERTGIFSSEGVRLVLEKGGRRYFTLLNFMLWYLIYIENVMEDRLPYLKTWQQS